MANKSITLWIIFNIVGMVMIMLDLEGF